MNWNYITGFFDADGYITFIKPSKNQHKTVVVGFTNTKRIILELIQEFIYQQTKQKGFICKKKTNQPNGLICLKGGDLHQEISESGVRPKMMSISDIFQEDYFKEKFIIQVKK